MTERICKVCGERIYTDVVVEGEVSANLLPAISTYDLITDEAIYYHIGCYK